MRPSRTVSNVKWVLLTSGGVNLITMARGVILARLLQPEDFGIVATALIFESILQHFSDMGIGSAVVYSQKESARVLPLALMMKSAFCCILAALVFFAAPLWGSLFGRDEVASVTRFAATLFLAEILIFPSKLQAQLALRFKDLSIPRVGAALVGCVTAATMALSGFSYWSIIWGILAERLAEAALLFRVFPWRVRFVWDRSLALELWRYGRHVIASSILNGLILKVDNLLVGKLLGLTALGYYVIAFRWANFASRQVASAIGAVLFPTFSRWRATDQNLIGKFQIAMRMSAAIYMPISVGLLVVAPEFVRVVLGERWLPAVVPMQVLCVAAIFRAIGNPITKLLLALGRPDWDVWFQASFLLSLIVFVPLFSLWLGLLGVSIAVLTAAIPWYFGARVVALRRVTGVGFKQIGRALLPAITASALMAAGVLSAKAMLQNASAGAIFLTFQVGLGGVLYVSAIFVLMGREVCAMLRPVTPGTRV